MTLDQDTIFHTLSNERRRSVIRVLRGRDTVTVRELTAAVAGIEYGLDPDQLDYRQRKRVYTSLVQTHLPSMASHGLVEYDKDRGVVTAERSLDTFEPYLDDGASVARSNAWTFLSLAGVFAVLTVLLAVDAPFVGSLPAFGVALAATVGVGALAAMALRDARRSTDAPRHDEGNEYRSVGTVVGLARSIQFFRR
jgi:hypothetical protein